MDQVQPQDILNESRFNMQAKYGDSVLIVPVIWPSLNLPMPLGYFGDRKRAHRAGEALRHIWEEIGDVCLRRRQLPSKRFHLYSHSMGSWVLYNFAKSINVPRPPLKIKPNQTQHCPRFSCIFLVAANAPTELFQKDSPSMKQAGGNITSIADKVVVVYSRKDNVLSFVDRVPFLMGNQDLGFRGPGDKASLPRNVIAVDTAQITGEMHHFHTPNLNSKFVAYVKSCFSIKPEEMKARNHQQNKQQQAEVSASSSVSGGNRSVGGDCSIPGSPESEADRSVGRSMRSPTSVTR
mmetsp:Transcript_25515/g.45324  ORF Transcript_25515/g.45324 Transcript_25515/m.45324 type:complete len:293 (+) Transcript_25515:3-881(+)